ncbi:DUF2793 domain-containing protein [Sphingomonas donggukensis]|uniref:DUF2793 domain-containing protein n=1 Tax=Sphingomonas donggukensis TaxID=2949093 RepID=A0ABY4TU29_9SPHN|nr:DUF2793 domain-containing protein [Sphingomonas donggukensis]URW75459.1 DUF2793 domain-containing protein [Sphingomonas donggukensis]
MTDMTARFALPFIQPGQAQKEMTHNEALASIDIALHAGVVAAGIDVPPASPAPGACWIVGDSPVGAWSGHARMLAGWSDGGWRFVPPCEGMTAWVAADARRLLFRNGSWAVGPVAADILTVGGHAMLGAPVAAIAGPAGGATVDAEGRSTIAAILSALRHHGLMIGA